MARGPRSGPARLQSRSRPGHHRGHHGGLLHTALARVHPGVFGQLVRRSARGAAAIEQLVHLTPDVARVVRNGTEQEVRLTEVKCATLSVSVLEKTCR